MSYIKHMLLPEERVLYDGHVHPRVLMPGLLLLGIAAIILIESDNTGGGHSVILSIVYSLSDSFASMQSLYKVLWDWQRNSPDISLEIKVLALLVALYGLYRLVKGFVLMQTTELVVTTSRIIAKTGVFAIITIEMDKNRVAEVTVYQTFSGRIMGYGNIVIHGFTNSIVGLPIMANPHLVEKFVG